MITKHTSRKSSDTIITRRTTRDPAFIDLILKRILSIRLLERKRWMESRMGVRDGRGWKEVGDRERCGGGGEGEKRKEFKQTIYTV